MWLIYAITASILWGLNYSLCEKIFSSKISPITLLALQMAFGVVVFFTAAIHTRLKQDVAILIADTKLLWLMLGTIIIADLGNLLISLSIQAKNATLAGLIELSYPLFTLIFTLILFKVNHFNLSTLIGGIFIMAGVIIISYYN